MNYTFDGSGSLTQQYVSDNIGSITNITILGYTGIDVCILPNRV